MMEKPIILVDGEDLDVLSLNWHKNKLISVHFETEYDGLTLFTPNELHEHWHDYDGRYYDVEINPSHNIRGYKEGEGMEFEVGDKIKGVENYNKGIVKEIVEVRKTGYTWKYEGDEKHFRSENSTDPHFDWGWIRLIQKKNSKNRTT